MVIFGDLFQPHHYIAPFFLTIVDEYYKCTWIFKNKSKLEKVKYIFIIFNQFIKHYKGNVHNISSGSETF